MQCIYTMRYYFSVMKKEVKKFAGKWNKLEKFIPSEVLFHRQILSSTPLFYEFNLEHSWEAGNEKADLWGTQ